MQDQLKLGIAVADWGPAGDRYEIRYLVKCVFSARSSSCIIHSRHCTDHGLAFDRWKGYDDPSECVARPPPLSLLQAD